MVRGIVIWMGVVRPLTAISWMSIREFGVDRYVDWSDRSTWIDMGTASLEADTKATERLSMMITEAWHASY